MSDGALTAAILVGGTSRRMGRNKALLSLTPGSPTIVETVAGKLRTVTDDVILVGANATAGDYAFLGLRHVPDIIQGVGALGGIHAALTASAHPRVLVVGCDMPFLNVELLRYMASHARGGDALVPLLGQPQPLHAIYAQSCLPLIDASLRAGRYKVTGWFADADVRILPRSIMESLDPGLHSCFNMNTPDDLADASRIARSDRDRNP